ncbi:MAG: LacI family DNA-binding transcriptional regulator [Ignavibacteriales bacterium]|nr:LacI family DNA-binding transcriptional regulator [Ignavibacteriales bacterium]
MAINIKELAALAKVSIATVSRALNGDSKVRPKTREAIEALAKAYNYNPNLLARSFVKKQSNIIGLVLPEISDEFFTEIIRGVDEASYAQDFFCMVASSHANRSIVESILNFMNNGLTGGLIVMLSEITPEIKKVLQNRNLPVAIISGDDHLKGFDTVGFDNFVGAYNIVNHLVKRGYKRIAHISGPDNNEDSKKRKAGFIEALADNKIKLDPALIIKGDFTRAGGEKACTELLNLKKKPDAIFASNDMSAIGCYEALHKAGLKIPKDIAVTGFDDIYISHFLNPPLTTIRVPISEIGKAAANLVIEKVRNGKETGEQHININTELIIRKSS